ncbi:mechanosensitive ion channel family protein [Noviherbaspirillum pedocola]|uniref:Small-conductance mechanosensitive channel n=1 Tax=Noviherbaspirillum pedocola TaxID=2801341 RepID=A0A934SVX5_9BURK|nr:mechanosensitive ion channel family protein [Noviherbaspirillum pedocola]MBK4736579.1 mechanosensitive ion channel family protein [Noviherbaspirillum pedocola]
MQSELLIAYERLQQLITNAMRLLPSAALGILVFILFLFTARGIKALVQQFAARRRHRNLALVLGRVAQWGTLLFGLLLAVTIAFPSFTPANLISALGITGIAIGFAFKDIFENFLAGILILVTEPFRIDDQIVFGSYEGTIEKIETRATTLRTYDGRAVIIPNAELFKASVIVNTALDIRRMQYDVGIGNGDDIQLAKHVMLEAVRGVDGIVSEPVPDALVIGYGDYNVTIRLRWWIKPPRRADALDITDKVLERVKLALTVHGIDLPFPTSQLLFHDQTEDTDGDRKQQREGWPAANGSQVPAPRSIAGAIHARGAPARSDGVAQ